MTLTGGPYFIFLIVVFFLYWAMAALSGGRIWLLVAAGLFFYVSSGPIPLLVLLVVSAIDFNTTKLMSATSGRARRRFLLLISLSIDLGALVLFKYADFILGSLISALSSFGIASASGPFSIVAPIGISFFTFQSIGYVVDVYRKDAEPAARYIDYLAFVSFFPTILAGPILRARQLIPQLGGFLTLDSVAGGRGLFLIATGLIKKVAIADYLSANLVDRVFDFPERFSSLEVLGAVYGYALQIYADFSGYSDIAIGSALLLGITLPANFNAPYRARNLADFWRRWHISLSSWLRDYVYFSLVGLRSRKIAVLYGGLILTMVIGGLWHGASWTFVLWGLVHGMGLVVNRAWDRLAGRLPNRDWFARWFGVVGVLLTFHFVCLAWILFRAESVGTAVSIGSRLAALTFDAMNLAPSVWFVIVLGFVAHWMPGWIWDSACSLFVRLPATAQACLLFCVAIGLYSVASEDVVPFIYSRF